MSEQRCRTCRWWGHDESTRWRRLDRLETQRACLSPHVHFSCTEDVPNDEREDWDLLSRLVDEETGTPLAPSEAGVLDGSGYFGKLVTGPEFGCVHWEPAEPGTPEAR